MTCHLIHRLHGEHALLEVALAQEIRRPEPDGRTLKEIKRRKLRVKDRLQALERETATEGLHA